MITIARRDIARMIAAGVGASVCADWTALHRRLQALAVHPRRTQAPETLEVALNELTRLQTECLANLEAALPAEAPAPLQGAKEFSDSGPAFESEPIARAPLDPCNSDAQEAPSEARSPTQDTIFKSAIGESDETASIEADSAGPPASGISRVPLFLVLAACPDICDYARGGIRTFQDLFAAADLVRSLLGVTLDAWEEALRIMGCEGAATVIAAILQRGEAIRSPGGYFRSLTRRAAEGRFSAWPMLMALDAARRKASAAESAQDFSTGGSRPIALRCS